MGLWNDIKRIFIKEVPIQQTINPPDRHPEGIVVNHIHVRPIHRETQDIQKWRRAIIIAESAGQNRKQLYDLYEDMLMDGFLSAVIDKRVRAILNRDLVFVRDGEREWEISNLAKRSFFEDLLRELMLARIWGHSLVEMNWPAPGSPTKGWSKLVNRKHVKPRYGIVTQEPWDNRGIAYREKPFNLNCIEAGGDEDLGLMCKAAQYVIYKRGNFGDWAEFAEVFGMPFRFGTYNNEQSREMLEKALEAAGSAGYMVAPDDVKLQFLTGNNTQSGGGGVFDALREACNEEIAITILGNTMTTTEAAHSGYAQGMVHGMSQAEVHAEDRQYILRILNEELTDYLQALGYPVTGGEWMFSDPDATPLKDRIEIDMKVAQQVPIPASYWYEKYGIPMPSADDPPYTPEDPDPQEPKDPEPVNDEDE